MKKASPFLFQDYGPFGAYPSHTLRVRAPPIHKPMGGHGFACQHPQKFRSLSRVYCKMIQLGTVPFCIILWLQ